MNASPIRPGRPGRPPWPVRLVSFLLSAVVGAGVLVIAGGPAAALPAVGERRLYVVTNGLTGHAMDNANHSTHHHTPLIQWPLHGGTNQEWFITHYDGHYKFQNRHSGLCLTVDLDETITQAQCGFNYGRNRWRITPVSNGTYYVQLGTDPTTGSPAVTSGTYLAAPATPTPGGQLTLVDWGVHDITWRFEEVPLVKPYTLEASTNVSGWQIGAVAGECKEGWRVETLPGSVKPRYDYIGAGDLNVHDWTAKIVNSSTGTRLGSLVEILNEPKEYRKMTVDVGNPLWHTMEAKIRIYCVPV